MGTFYALNKFGPKIEEKGGGHFLDRALAPLIQFKKIDYFQSNCMYNFTRGLRLLMLEKENFIAS